MHPRLGEFPPVAEQASLAEAQYLPSSWGGNRWVRGCTYTPGKCSAQRASPGRSKMDPCLVRALGRQLAIRGIFIWRLSHHLPCEYWGLTCSDTIRQELKIKLQCILIYKAPESTRQVFYELTVLFTNWFFHILYW